MANDQDPSNQRAYYRLKVEGTVRFESPDLSGEAQIGDLSMGGVSMVVPKKQLALLENVKPNSRFKLLIVHEELSDDVEIAEAKFVRCWREPIPGFALRFVRVSMDSMNALEDMLERTETKRA